MAGLRFVLCLLVLLWALPGVAADVQTNIGGFRPLQTLDGSTAVSCGTAARLWQVPIVGNAAPITLGALDPQIADGVSPGQLCDIVCTSATDTVTFTHGQGLSLRKGVGTFICGGDEGNRLPLTWNADISLWEQRGPIQDSAEDYRFNSPIGEYRYQDSTGGQTTFNMGPAGMTVTPSATLSFSLPQPVPSLQTVFDTHNGIITNITAADPIKFCGPDPEGACLVFYESSGDMFFECVMADGTPCDHTFELSNNRRFRVGTASRPDAYNIAHAEPETMDVECRTDDPTPPTSNRLKVYCKSDAAYMRDDTGTVTALAGGGGVGNAFFAVAGPATSTKTFTFPNATSTVLTDNTDVTVAQGGTGLSAGTSGGIPYFSGTTTIASSAALTANAVIVGGGAGATPAALASLGTAGQVLTSNGAGTPPSFQAGAGGVAGARDPIRPSSAIPSGAGAYGCNILLNDMMCVTTAALLTADVKWHLKFPMPAVLPTDCTYRLRVDLISDGTPGTNVISLRPEWNTWATGAARPTGGGLISETVTADVVAGNAGSGVTIGLTSADAGQLLTVQWTLNAATYIANQPIALDLVAVDATHTLTVPFGMDPYLICTP